MLKSCSPFRQSWTSLSVVVNAKYRGVRLSPNAMDAVEWESSNSFESSSSGKFKRYYFNVISAGKQMLGDTLRITADEGAVQSGGEQDLQGLSCPFFRGKIRVFSLAQAVLRRAANHGGACYNRLGSNLSYKGYWNHDPR